MVEDNVIWMWYRAEVVYKTGEKNGRVLLKDGLKK